MMKNPFENTKSNRIVSSLCHYRHFLKNSSKSAHNFSSYFANCLMHAASCRYWSTCICHNGNLKHSNILPFVLISKFGDTIIITSTKELCFLICSSVFVLDYTKTNGQILQGKKIMGLT